MAIVAIQNPMFQPAMRIIAAITNANPAVVTTTFDHNYLDGETLRLNIPVRFGMQQANQLTGTIRVLSPTTFEISIDSTRFDTFTTPATWPFDRQYAQVTPVGEINALLRGATQNVLPFNVRT